MRGGVCGCLIAIGLVVLFAWVNVSVLSGVIRVVVFRVIGVGPSFESLVDVHGGSVGVYEVGHVIFFLFGDVFVGGDIGRTVLCAHVSDERVHLRMDKFGVVFVQDFFVDESRVFDLLTEVGLEEVQLDGEKRS